MDIKTAKRIGRNQTFKAILIGLVIAYAIMAIFSFQDNLMYSLLWFKDVDFKSNLIVGIISIIIIGKYIGKYVGIVILKRGADKYWAGIVYGFIILVSSTFITALFGLFQNTGRTLGVSFKDEVFDYIWKPLFWVLFFGFIPTILIGLWYGYSIKKNGGGIN